MLSASRTNWKELPKMQFALPNNGNRQTSGESASLPQPKLRRVPIMGHVKIKNNIPVLPYKWIYA